MPQMKLIGAPLVLASTGHYVYYDATVPIFTL